jgi:Domain of unknown function (DUF4340)
MTLRRLGLLTGILALLLAFILILERRIPTTQERLDRGDVLWQVDEPRIVKIEIMRDGAALEFSRTPASDWRMVRPESYPADSGSLSALVFDLARPAREGEAPAAANEPDYGLVAPRAVVTITTKEEKGKRAEVHTVSIGKEIPGTDTVAARVKGENRTVFVRSNLATELVKPVDAYKSKKVFQATLSDVSQVTILRGRGRLDFEKRNDAWWMTRPAADLAASAQVTRLLEDILAANVVEFVKISKADLAGDGLAPAIYTVTITASKKPATLEIGATRADGKSVYARSSEQTFAMDATLTDELSKEADAYRETKVARFEAPSVRELEWKSGETSRSLKKDGSDWKEGGKTIPATAVDDVLSAIASLDAKDFLGAPATRDLESRTETASWKVGLASGGSISVSVRPESPGRVAAKVSDRPEALLLPSGDLDKVVAAVKRLPAATAPPAPSSPKKPSR